MSDPREEQSLALNRQIEELVGQLARAEKALAEALGGKVDAVINPETATPILLQEAQQRLQKSEARYRRLISNMSAVIFEMEPRGRILFINNAIGAITGYRSQDLFGANFWGVFFPGEQHRQAEAILAAVQHDDIRNYEVILTAKDTALISLAVTTANYYGVNKSLENILGIGVDITAQKQTELELVRYRRQLGL